VPTSPTRRRSPHAARPLAEHPALAGGTGGFTTREVAEASGLPTAKILSWTRAGLLTPARGDDDAYVFSFQDLVLLRSARDLLVADVPARKVRAALEALRAQLPSGRPLSAVHISALGDRVLVRDEQRVWEPDSGQMLLDLGAPAARAEAVEGHEAAHDVIGSADDWYNAALDLEASDPGQAITAYESALCIDPMHADAHLNLGRLLHDGGDLEGAERHYRAAAEADPESGRARFNLGVLAEDRCRAEEAMAEYREALRLDEGLAPAHFNLSRLQEARGAEGEALAHLLAYKRLISSLRPSAS
jgi:tetratricopeptide (TPR) repeat protein